jgi:hypothetical protein
LSSSLGPVVIALLAIVAILPASADALVNEDPNFWKQTAERRATVDRLMYSQSPQSIPSSYDPVQEAEQILRSQQRSLPASNPQVPRLWQQVRSVTAKSALSTPLRALGTVSLAVGTFELGWKIGNGFNAKFLRIGLPANGEIPAAYSSPQLSFRSAGQTSQLWYKVPVPEDGWVWSVYSSAYSYQRSMEYRPRVANGECQSQAFTPPAGFIEVSAPAQEYSCNTNPNLVDVNELKSAYLPENGLTAPSPIEDYTSQPYDRSSPAPAAPPRSDVEQAISSELDKPENAVLRDWLNYELGSPGQSDPTGVGEPNPRDIMTMPDCASLVYESCKQLLEQSGFAGTMVRQNKTFEAVDVIKPADTVLSTTPTTGAHVNAVSGTITVTANPPDIDMPRLVPSATAHETKAAYSARLSALNLVPDEHVVTQTPGASWAGDVLSTTPTAGTRVRRDTSVGTQSAWRPEALTAQDESQDSSCEPSSPRYEAPGLFGSFTPGDPPAFPSIDGSVSFWKGELTNGPQGWGERHIANKHGWEIQDKADTAQTLITPDFSERDRPDARALEPYFYVKAMPSRNGKLCARFVRVERGTWPSEPSMRGIITSFGLQRSY